MFQFAERCWKRATTINNAKIQQQKRAKKISVFAKKYKKKK